MIKLEAFNNKSKLPEADYVLDKSEKLLSLLEVLTPKFKGEWDILLVDPRIKEVKNLVDLDLIPDYVNCVLYLPQAKLDIVVMDYPKLAPKQKSNKEVYKEMISGLSHMIDKGAMWLIYNTIGSNLSSLQEAIDKLDKECEGTTITVKQVQNTFAVQKRVYASDVLRAFLVKDRYRWLKLNTLVRDLGQDYAYHAIYKQVRELLAQKDAYLHNEDTKGNVVQIVDAPFICYVYVLFANSTSWRNLYGIMYSIDHRNASTLERSQYVNLQ